MSPIRHNRSIIPAVAMAFVMIGFVRQAAAEAEQVEFEVVPPVEVGLAGTSTLHNWTCVGDRIDLSTQMELTVDEFLEAVDAAWSGNLPLPVNFENKEEISGTPLIVEVPIESLECDRSRMQRDLRETVKFDDYPVIEYELEAVRETSIGDNDQNDQTVLYLEVTGKLTVAGVGRSVDHQVVITRLSSDRFEVRGELDLKMSWFDMEPPTALFGLLKAHDPFQVNFLFQAGIRNGTAPASD